MLNNNRKDIEAKIAKDWALALEHGVIIVVDPEAANDYIQMAIEALRGPTHDSLWKAGPQRISVFRFAEGVTRQALIEGGYLLTGSAHPAMHLMSTLANPGFKLWQNARLVGLTGEGLPEIGSMCQVAVAECLHRGENINLEGWLRALDSPAIRTTFDLELFELISAGWKFSDGNRNKMLLAYHAKIAATPYQNVMQWATELKEIRLLLTPELSAEQRAELQSQLNEIDSVASGAFKAKRDELIKQETLLKDLLVL